MKLNPTLWRTCRVLASEPRLALLRQLFDQPELCVNQLADLTGMSKNNASTQLRSLHARGLISMRRKKMEVLYRAEANTTLHSAPLLLEALRTGHAQSTSFKTIIRMATACTHERRIEILRSLKQKPKNAQELIRATGMSGSALVRHIDKLIARNFVKEQNDTYRIAYPGNCFGRTLLKIAVEQG